MALLLRDLTLDVSDDEQKLPLVAADFLGVDVKILRHLKIVRRSIDARKKSRILKVYTIEFSCPNEADLVDRVASNRLEQLPERTETVQPRVKAKHHALVVGMGPAGLFAAKRLAECGVSVTLIDRGRPVEQRIKDVESFWASAQFDAVSNVQFGEGGAGTFSDGKLTTRLNHPQRLSVLQALVDCGAPEDILIEARPHVGTDRLRKVVINFREHLITLGVTVLFEKCLIDLDVHQGRVVGAVFNGGETLACDSLVLAPGHSARDTYLMLDRNAVQLEAKGFAVGVRVEHPAELINQIQYGAFAERLPAADYALRYNDDESGRGVYSFCMCPGGEVINAASEVDGLVVNGMSRMARKGEYSNSALVVTVGPQDWGGEKLGGMHFQQEWERKAFTVGGAGFLAPAQNMMSFVGQGQGALSSSCRPGVVESELREVLPDFVYSGLRKALPHFNRKMKGFMTSEAVLIGVETRTSAPLRIPRNDRGESVSHPGLYPTGEGAGYAGGIMSAALDGLRAADQVVESIL
ncbi:FAD-dependent oxidoreductase [Deltaproteobacteria bacterium IMCC39524]|nr:FAD-dependent oxidoreductase [Deltaproteobacteria bacterium IMCC39524]